MATDYLGSELIEEFVSYVSLKHTQTIRWNPWIYLLFFILLTSASFCSCCSAALSCPSNSFEPHGRKPTRLLCPLNFPHKCPRVGFHFLFQGIILFRDGTRVSCISKHILYCWATREDLYANFISKFQTVILDFLTLKFSVQNLTQNYLPWCPLPQSLYKYLVCHVISILILTILHFSNSLISEIYIFILYI